MLNFQKSPKSSLLAKVKAQNLGFSPKKGGEKMADFDPILTKFLYLTHLMSFNHLYAGMSGYFTCWDKFKTKFYDNCTSKFDFPGARQSFEKKPQKFVIFT